MISAAQLAPNEPPRLALAALPTPLVKLERLSAELGDARLWLKRDDYTGVETSGNKIRKLEYVFADMQLDGADAIVTEGTAQSNHCRAAAAVAARLGLHCTLLFRPFPPTDINGNHLLDSLFGAETRCYSREDYTRRKAEIIADVCDDLRAAGRKPRYTPMGASEPLGCWGYMRAFAELAQQLDAAQIGPCDVVVAISSGATYAGLLLGKYLHARHDVQLTAVPVSDDIAHHTENVLQLCVTTAGEWSLGVDIEPSLLKFIDGYVGDGYAIPYDEDVHAIKMLAHLEGVMLDPVYTGKAFAAFLDAVRAGKLGRERPAIFWHTGGVFSNFAWPTLLLEGVSSSQPRT